MASSSEAMQGRRKLWWVLVIICLLAACDTRAASINEDEEEALRTFLNATLPSSSLQQSFNLSAPICSWTSKVRCSSVNGPVNGLSLESMGLRGVIPVDTLGRLSSLTNLSLYNNSLQSPIPAEIWNLSSLKDLSLSLNAFNEPVPQKLSELKVLQKLDLSHNRFHGTVPQLRSLRYLFLSFNGFSGSIPRALFESPSLRTIDLANNSFTGTLPPLVANLRNLANLKLSGNHLKGGLPSDIHTLRRLSVLDLSNNGFTGNLTALNASSSLEEVILSNNEFVGAVPQLRSCREVRMNGNHLYGHLQPEVFGPQLTELDLSFNGFSGDVTEFLNRSSPSIAYLDLSANNFSGSLSEVNFGAHTALNHLDLSSNRIEGGIPDSIGKASGLTYVNLSKNRFNGSIPASITRLVFLQQLDLSSNALTGNVSWLSEMHSLKKLNLSDNKQLGCNSALVGAFGQDSFKGILDCHPSAADISIPAMARSQKKVNWGFVAGITVGCAIFATLIFAFLALVACKRRGRWPHHSSLSVKQRTAIYKEGNRFISGPFSFESNSGPWAANVKNARSVPVIMFEKPLLNLTFADLLRATSNFNRETQVSQGGLGPVYSAVLPAGDLHVSIKVLIEGRILTNEVAMAEFASLSKIKHPNLVPLLGYCIVGEERLVIYEFMRKGGLHRWLLGTPEWSHPMSNNHIFHEVSTDLANRANMEPLPEAINLSWAVRHKIALGVARSLAFLHHGQSVKMVHRDVKASNVMLDEEFEAHLANTGLAGLLAGSDEALFAGGSPGYAPPEYGKGGGKVSTMGDVYSYGVILLELVTGKKPVGDSYDEEGADTGMGFGGRRPGITDLVGWVRMLMHEKRPASLVRALDPRAWEDQISEGQMLEVLRMGYLCTAESPEKRPTIQQVVGLLKDMAPNMTSP